MFTRAILVSCLLLAIPITGLALATTLREQPKGPPPQAYAACKDKKAGDAVIVETFNGRTIQAVCQTFYGQLAANPVIPPPDKSKARSE